MREKYWVITLFQIENGWIVQKAPPEDLGQVNQVKYHSQFCKDMDEVVEYLKKMEV